MKTKWAICFTHPPVLVNVIREDQFDANRTVVSPVECPRLAMSVKNCWLFDNAREAHRFLDTAGSYDGEKVDGTDSVIPVDEGTLPKAPR